MSSLSNESTGTVTQQARHTPLTDAALESATTAGNTPPVKEEKAAHLGLIFAALMVAMLLSSLNQTVLSTALPTIVGELNGVEHMSWVITAFILASTIMMPVYGKLGDIFGRKPLLIFAISTFLVGSFIGGIAPDMNILILARAIQGIGGGGLMILSQAIIADVVPARERGKYMGVMGGVFAFSSVAGPLIGGWLTEGPGWRWTFWMNLPLGIIAIIAAATLLKIHKPVHETRPKIDYLGMILVAIATTAIVLVATWGGSQFAWTSVEILSLIGIGVLASVLFVWAESKATNPIIPLALFRNKNFNLTTIAGLVVGIAMFGAIGYMPTYLQMVTGYGPSEAGLLMIPMMASLLILSIITGRYVTATGRYKKVMIAGTIVTALGLYLLSTLQVEAPVWLICVYLAVMGMGLGAAMQLLTLVAQNSFPISMVGTATAGQNYFRQVGATLGSAIVGSVFATRLGEILAERLPANAGGEHASASLTPAIVNALPDQIKEIVIGAYNEALIPLFLWLVPVILIGVVALFFVEEKPLATKIERD